MISIRRCRSHRSKESSFDPVPERSGYGIGHGAARVGERLRQEASAQTRAQHSFRTGLPGHTDAVLRISAVHGDITQQDTDAVVNAANNAMRGGGGVDGAIHRAGGPVILQDCIRRFPDGLATGDAGWTTAGELPARWVIHTVGPNYRAGQRDRALLQSCYRRALEVADELAAHSVAFPLISTGAYAWPLQDAITIAVETIAATTTDVAEVKLVAFDAKTHALLDAQLAMSTPLRILQGIRVLHRRGHHQIRALPGVSPSGLHWRIAITTTDNLGHGHIWEVLDQDAVVGYTTGAESGFAGSEVTAASSPETVADLIARSLGSSVPMVDDPEYAAWFDGLMELVERENRLPIAYDANFGPASGCEIGGVRYPAPPLP